MTTLLQANRDGVEQRVPITDPDGKPGGYLMMEVRVQVRLGLVVQLWPRLSVLNAYTWFTTGPFIHADTGPCAEQHAGDDGRRWVSA